MGACSSGGQCRLLPGGWGGRAGGGLWSGGSSAGRSALAGAGWSGGNWACRQGAGRVGAGGFRQASPIASGTGGRGPGRRCRAERAVHTWSGLRSNGSRGRARVGWELGESTRGEFPKMSGRAVFGRVSAGPPADGTRTVRAVSAGPARAWRVPGVSDYKWHRGWADVGRRSGGSVGVVLRSGWTDVGRPGDCGGCG